jgi:DNA mismatch repair protein MutS2
VEERALKILEYDKVLERIAEHAACSLGKEKILAMKPFDTLELAEMELAAVDEALQVLYRYGTLPFGGITDIRPYLRKAMIGGVLSPGNLLSIADFIYGGRRVRQAILSADESMELTTLRHQASLLFDARQTEIEIRQAIADDGTVLDHASPTLRNLRTSRRQLESKVRQILDQLLRTHQKYLQDPVIAMRGNSLCLPVRIEYKHMLPGVVRDYSASGATIYVEPNAALEANQKIQELLVEEEREIERILARLSGVVAEVADSLQANVDILTNMDVWFAKASYAKANRCERPRLRSDGVWRFRRARHPLIERNQAVPMDLTVGESYHMVIITGPNTGGKTVTLKTIGLLTLLAMCGCFIPTESPSDIGWVDNIFVDIGDEQSIEQSLSTFSSHMKNIIHMLDRVTKDSLVLLDELGAGTDPTEGAALATAILDYLKSWGCRVIATTHYSELKSYAFQAPEAINASVEFDVETLKPTYRLLVGVPGRSNALAIASRLGLSDYIVGKAKSFMQTSDIRVEDLIAKLEVARREAEVALDEARAEREAAKALREAMEQKWAKVDEDVEQSRRRALAEAKEILDKAQKEAKRIIDELRSMKYRANIKDHELVELRKALESAVPTDVQPSRQKARSRPKTDIPVGSIVRVLSLGQTGEVVESIAGGKEYMVQLGLLKMKVAASDVEFIQKAVQQETTSFKRSSTPNVKLQLDIRGETVDDAIVQIDKFLDDAVINGLSRVTIIHGKGTGALRDGVRRYLSKHRQVESWAPGGPGDGGDGATIVEVRP